MGDAHRVAGREGLLHAFVQLLIHGRIRRQLDVVHRVARVGGRSACRLRLTLLSGEGHVCLLSGATCKLHAAWRKETDCYEESLNEPWLCWPWPDGTSDGRAPEGRGPQPEALQPHASLRGSAGEARRGARRRG